MRQNHFKVFAKVFIGLLLMSLLTTPLFAQDAAPVTHLVQHGDSLYRIALRYGVTIDALVKENQLPNQSRILVGQTLTIPGLTVPEDTAVENPLVAAAPHQHTILPGETLQSIAQQYGISVADLLKSNNIANPNLIYRGQKLNVWTTATGNTDTVIEAPPVTVDFSGEPQINETVDVNTAPAVRSTYTVQRGETLHAIAQRYGLTWTDLASFNGIQNPNHITYGQSLLIPSSANPTGARANPENRAPIIPPQPTITEGKLIMVDLSDSMIYAYQDGSLIYSALGSMGLPATPTVTGEYKIYLRYRIQNMSGPGYYLPGVEWVQYFYQGYGIHGTYWHTNWGQPMSRGCVNLSNTDAEWFYHFGEIGTPVHVNY